MSVYLEEEWKELMVTGTEGRYKISNYSRVKDITKGVLVSQVITGKPAYWYVNLSLGKGKRTLKRVHRLCAETFLPNKDNLPVVDHKDRNKYNNSLDNLRWVTRSQNQQNRDVTRMFMGVPLKTYCEAHFKHPEGAYSYLINKLCYNELTEEDALSHYNNFLQYGIKGNTVVSVYGEDMLLPIFLEQLKLGSADYLEKIRQGLSNEELQRGYRHTLVHKDYPNSIEILSTERDAWLYYPSRVPLAEDLGMVCDTIKMREYLGLETFEQYRDYINPNHLYNYEDFEGTLQQLADKYNLRVETLRDRVCGKRWSLEKALITKRQKIRHYIHNGVRVTKREVWEYYFLGVDTRGRNKLSGEHSRPKNKHMTLLEFLHFKGIDISNTTLEPCT